ncbi:MAG: PAS domain S-box protein [Chloroflexi bacterium]|jgi:PAS domain S-box-containing protein|nr:PAS domain S-box protein [Chloroflexota bacterium]
MSKVLVIDDDADFVRYLSRRLSDEGYDVVSANSGFEGIKSAERECPDVILLDVVMLEMDGYETCRQLKAHPEVGSIPIIIVTVRDKEDEMVNGLDAGANDYATKPIVLPVLLARLRSAIRTKKDRDAISHEVAERKRIEVALRASEEKYRDLFENAHDLIQSVDADGRFMYVNSAWLNTLGYEKDDLENLKLTDVITADQTTQCMDLLNQVIQGQEFTNIQTTFLTKEGQEVYVEGNVNAWVKDGIFVATRGIFRDITERKLAEAAANRANSKLSARLKELNCLYGLSTLAALPEKMERIFQRLVDSLPHAWQYPELTCARVTYNGTEYTTTNFEVTRWKLSTEIVASSEAVGTVEVYYQKEMPDLHEGPFTIGERHIIDSVASQLGAICEHRQAEEALTKSEEKLRAIFENASDPIIHLDMSGIIVNANTRIKDIFGYEPREVIGRNFAELDFISSECVKAVSKRFNSMMVGSDVGGVIELEVSHKKGHLVSVEASLGPLQKHGKTEGLLVIARDVSERKRSEMALKESEEKLSTMFGTIGDGVSVTDLEGTVVEANEAFCRMFKHDQKKQVVGRNAAEFIAEKDHDKLMNHTMSVLECGINDTREYTLLDKSGREFEGEITASLMHDSSGHPAGFVSVTRDITERKQSEKELQDSLNSQRILVGYLNSIPTPTLTIDKGFNITFINPAGAAAVGNTVEQVTGIKCYDLFKNNHCHTSKCFCKKAMSKDKTVSGECVIDTDRRDLPVIYTAAPIKDAEGKTTGALAHMVDITNLKSAEKEQSEILKAKQEQNDLLIKAHTELEQALNEIRISQEERERLNRELEDINKELEQVIYVTSHDLRSPMVNIQGFSRELDVSVKELISIIEKEDILPEVRENFIPVLEEDIPESLNFIQSSVSKMEILLSGLLQVSRAGRLTPSLTDLDMNALIVDVQNSFEHQLRERGVQVEISDLPNCFGDQSQMNQVFSNLLGNALKYLDTDRQGVIRVTGCKENDQVVYCVEDNGVGIPEEHKEKVFQMFHRIDANATPGEGLGLTIIKKIVGKHHGRMWLDSVYGIGSKFFVALPDKVDQRESLDSGSLVEPEGIVA